MNRFILILSIVLLCLPFSSARAQLVEKDNNLSINYVKKYHARLKLARIGFVVGGALVATAIGSAIFIEANELSLISALIGTGFIYEGFRSRKNARDLQRFMLRESQGLLERSTLNSCSYTSVERWALILVK